MNKLKLALFASVAAAALAVVADASAAATNSLVRFRINYGTTFFGDVDVELYDLEKPLTVSNFLANIQGGLYDNSILHDLRPGFTVQGGVGTVANPFSEQPFELITRVPTNTPIANEFGVGPLRGNVLGTLAMAKPSGSTNSASASWFFNLGNNTDGSGVTNLDTALGGYTVFGAVKRGLNVLSFLNTFTQDSGIQNLTNDFHFNFCAPVTLAPDGVPIGSDALPVGFYGVDCIRYADLFNVQIFVLDTPDFTAPKLAITSPAANASLATNIITVTGTASDAVAVNSVRVYLNTNTPAPATGTTSWSIALANVPPGTNVVVAEALDATGNRVEASRKFFHSVRAPITVSKVGLGTITGPANGALLELTRASSLTAKAAPGYLFAGWTGTVSSASATLPFIMESNFTVTAVFVTNLFPSIKGVYNGLFHDTQVEQKSSGFLNLVMGTFGDYSAKLLMNGKSLRFSGHFSPDGGETNLIFRPNTNALLIRLHADLVGGSDQLTGSITNNQIFAVDTNASWDAQIAADRAVFGITNAPLAGGYTMLVPSDPLSPAGPDGIGYAKVGVSTKGIVSLAGVLADGTKAAQKVPVSKNGDWPVYLPLYKGSGAVVSWINFDTNATNTDFSGLLTWIKQTQPATTKFYARGFTNQVTALGPRYVAPVGARAINVPNPIVGFTNGNLLVNFANAVTLGVDNKIVNGSANALSLSLQTSSGLFSGKVTPPAGGSALSFKGALLQKQNRGGGFLLGTNQSSEVTVQAP